MAPAALVGILTTGGYGIRLEGERLIVHPSDTMTDPLRNLIRTNKPALVRYLHRMQAPANDPAPAATQRNATAATSRLWLIRHADGRVVSHSFCPPATETEVRAWYSPGPRHRIRGGDR